MSEKKDVKKKDESVELDDEQLDEVSGGIPIDRCKVIGCKVIGTPLSNQSDLDFIEGGPNLKK